MKIEDRILFDKYAFPCLNETDVKRGRITQELADELTARVSENMEPSDGLEERLFPVAVSMCTFLARKANKKSIDADIIREYFLLTHNKVVDEQAELVRDVDPIRCKTYPGMVVKVEGGSAMVETVLGSRSYKTDFEKNVKKGDIVVVHFDHIVERITERMAEIMGRANGTELRKRQKDRSIS